MQLGAGERKERRKQKTSSEPGMRFYFQARAEISPKIEHGEAEKTFFWTISIPDFSVYGKVSWASGKHFISSALIALLSHLLANYLCLRLCVDVAGDLHLNVDVGVDPRLLHLDLRLV